MSTLRWFFVNFAERAELPAGSRFAPGEKLLTAVAKGSPREIHTHTRESLSGHVPSESSPGVVWC